MEAKKFFSKVTIASNRRNGPATLCSEISQQIL